MREGQTYVVFKQPPNLTEAGEMVWLFLVFLKTQRDIMSEILPDKNQRRRVRYAYQYQNRKPTYTPKRGA